MKPMTTEDYQNLLINGHISFKDALRYFADQEVEKATEPLVEALEKIQNHHCKNGYCETCYKWSSEAIIDYLAKYGDKK